MDAGYQTDDRLRKKLNSHQSARERLCLSILQLDRNFSNIKPRLPEGGPDQARDIECIRLGGKCYGAVGFVNDANDTNPQIRQIKKKFSDDLVAAFRADPDLKAFVFFTNINLTPGQIDELIALGEKRGLDFIDIYWRERLRGLLDSVEGFAFRFQYLGIPMSEPDQVTFFARFGKDLENLLLGKFEKIEQKLDEVQFYTWKYRTIHEIKLIVKLKKTFLLEEHGIEHFKFLGKLSSPGFVEVGYAIGGKTIYSKDSDSVRIGRFFYELGDEKFKESWVNLLMEYGSNTINSLVASVKFNMPSGISPFSMDNLHFSFACTDNLVEWIDYVLFILLTSR